MLAGDAYLLRFFVGGGVIIAHGVLLGVLFKTNAPSPPHVSSVSQVHVRLLTPISSLAAVSEHEAIRANDHTAKNVLPSPHSQEAISGGTRPTSRLSNLTPNVRQTEGSTSSLQSTLSQLSSDANLSLAEHPQASGDISSRSGEGHGVMSAPAYIPPNGSATHLNNSPPKYPALSLENEEEGRVLLRVFIQHNGEVGQVELSKSSGYPRLDQAAIDTVKRWRFIPATRQGQPIDEWYLQTIQFTLDQS